ncbi:MAG: hypothetical protein JW774_06400 [Candidatus Aureabacteria bacterium]|nr:hypothetical protein [Candidatus Auribacterota bacterium]
MSCHKHEFMVTLIFGVIFNVLFTAVPALAKPKPRLRDLNLPYTPQDGILNCFDENLVILEVNNHPVKSKKFPLYLPVGKNSIKVEYKSQPQFMGNNSYKYYKGDPFRLLFEVKPDENYFLFSETRNVFGHSNWLISETDKWFLYLFDSKGVPKGTRREEPVPEKLLSSLTVDSKPLPKPKDLINDAAQLLSIGRNFDDKYKGYFYNKAIKADPEIDFEKIIGPSPSIFNIIHSMIETDVLCTIYTKKNPAAKKLHGLVVLSRKYIDFLNKQTDLNPEAYNKRLCLMNTVQAKLYDFENKHDQAVGIYEKNIEMLKPFFTRSSGSSAFNMNLLDCNHKRLKLSYFDWAEKLLNEKKADAALKAIDSVLDMDFFPNAFLLKSRILSKLGRKKEADEEKLKAKQYKKWGYFYKGELKKNEPDGHGTGYYEPSSCYEGEWIKGKREGQGKMTWLYSVYIGSWKNNRQDGFGKMEWNDYEYSKGKKSFEGEWKQGCPKKGKMIYVDKIFEGEFKNWNPVESVKQS